LPGVFAVSNKQVNFYLVKANQKYVAFDTGVSEKMSLRGLAKLGIKPDDVTAVFLTHTDSDHAGGIGAFPRAKVYISKQEEPMIDGSTRRALFLGHNKLNRSYDTLGDGETIHVHGATINCMITPGHTKGSSCFVADGKYLFSGDNFSLKGGRTRPFIALFNMDGHEQRKSIPKIAGLQNIEAVFTGHHGYTKDFIYAFEDWR